jgi:tetratricopeptide (TPR) repeat protein
MLAFSSSNNDKYIQLMREYLGSLIVFCLGAATAGFAQIASSENSSKNSYSQESAVIEQMTTKLVFDTSGTYTREQVTKIHVQTDAGVKDWGLLSIPYQSALQSVDIDYVRVVKLDGSTVVTPADNIQDLDSEITRAAPFYSDLREKHIAVKGLSPGDTVEFKAHWVTTKALAPGQFWFEYNFHHTGIVLDERLEIRTPSTRTIKFKGPVETQSISAEPSFNVYKWTFSRLHDDKDASKDEQKTIQAALGRSPPPDVQISSFQSWDEVGQWYWNLQKDRIEPTGAVHAKAAEITKGLPDESAKVRALYSFVGTQYRYIGVAFGVGRYQPHAADDVLSNSYGDCKDKHTLLASLLQASGITIYPALVSATYKIDVDVPSPGQFDHVIGYLPQGNDAIWLDTTPEVAPFAYLLQPIRDKQALVIMGDKTSRLVTTPADPPMPSVHNFKIEGTLSEDGVLEAKIKDTVRGENEVYLRTVFRRVPQPQWKDLVQQISYTLGYAGTVSDVTASTPETISEPFQFSYSYHRKDYPDWSNRQFTLPGLPFVMPPVKEDAKYPIWLGPPLKTISESKVDLPKGYAPELPQGINLKYDFAEYYSWYSQSQNSISGTRRLVIRMREVPVAELDDYRYFIKHVQEDVNHYVQTSSSGSHNSSGTTMPSSFLNGIRGLSDSDSSEANRLESEARDWMSKKDMPAAISSLYRAVAADPKFARAWTSLGMLLIMQNQTDAGMEAFHKAMAADPTSPAIPKALGFMLMNIQKLEQAVPVWQDYVKAYPEDVDGPANLGNCLAGLRRYSEAAVAYASAVKIKPDQLNLQASLGNAYLLAGEREKSADVFVKLAAADTKGGYLNGVAYTMANADLRLPLALDMSKKATRAVEEETQDIELKDLTIDKFRIVNRLAAYWDTLGWVQERMSNLDVAERYLLASWKLSQDGVVAGHLCHLYKRTHKNQAAIEMCRMAIHRMYMTSNITLDLKTEEAAAQENLDHLTSGMPKPKDSTEGATLVIHERTFKLPHLLTGSESAEFLVLMVADGKGKAYKVDEVQFISGSDKMKSQGKQIKTIDFKVFSPTDVPTRFVRRGILSCSQYTGCSFVIFDPATVDSVH